MLSVPQQVAFRTPRVARSPCMDLGNTLRYCHKPDSPSSRIGLGDLRSHASYGSRTATGQSGVPIAIEPSGMRRDLGIQKAIARRAADTQMRYVQVSAVAVTSSSAGARLDSTDHINSAKLEAR